jgi:threonine/homoserine/homoserine lactone efflux protein
VGEAIGELLAFAVVVGVSPIPIIGVVLMLVTPRARVNGPAFLVGWIVGLAIVGTVVLVAVPDASDDDGTPATWVSGLQLAFGLLLGLLAIRQWRGRPREGAESPAPAWMTSVDRFTAPRAVGTGIVLSAANPKNLVMAVGAAASIAQAEIAPGEEAIAYAVFVAIGTLGVALPVLIFFALGAQRAAPPLERLKGWLGHNNAVIMAVLLLVIGAKLVGDAISGFSA